LYRFDELSGSGRVVDLVGSKAAGLLRLKAAGFPVPDGAVIGTEDFDAFVSGPALREAVRRLREPGENEAESVTERAAEVRAAMEKAPLPPDLVDRLERFGAEQPGVRFAVRSSGTAEDLPGESFAGLYGTELNVAPGPDLARAVKRCWASLFEPRVLVYCRDRGIGLGRLKMAVVVQEMVPADKSGVVFTVDPLEGLDRQMVMEACFGLGEALVAGEVNPDRYVYDWYHRREVRRQIGEKLVAAVPAADPPFVRRELIPPERRREAVLRAEEVAELAEICVSVQAQFGVPVDIEWAKHAGRVFLLQCRPITRISHQGIPGEWTTADFRDGGVASTVCTPYMWSLYDFIWEAAMPAYTTRVRLIHPREARGVVWGEMFYGRPYWNLHEVKKAAARLPGFKERNFDEDLGIEPAYEGDGRVTRTGVRTLWRGLRVLAGLKRSFREQMDLCPRFRAAQQARLAELDELSPDRMERGEFFRFFERFIREEYFRSESTYFNLIFDNANLQSLFKERCAGLGARCDMLVLLSGLNNLSHMKLNYRLWDVSREIRNDPGALEFWKCTAVADLVALWRAGHEEHGMRAVRACIREFRYHSTRELDIRVPRFGEDPSFVMENLKGHLTLGEEADPRAQNERQHAAYLREKERFLRAVPFTKRKKAEALLQRARDFLWWREELRDLSTRYYFHVRNATLVLARHLRDMGFLEEEDDVFFLTLQDMFSVIGGTAATEAVKDLIRRRRLYYASFRHFRNPNELGRRTRQRPNTAGKGERVLKGIASSPGEVTGRVRVIRDIFDADRLRQGDILVTAFTDPGWTPKFGLIAGVATETGGLLSHAAVISREYGIPAVLAVPGLTARLKDGQVVTLNGTEGEIIVRNEPE